MSIWLRREKQRQREEERTERNRVRGRDIETEMGNGDLGRTVGQLLRKMGLWGQKW